MPTLMPRIDYKNLKQGYPVQKREAEALHHLAGVKLGLCGIPELKKFQAALPDYHIKVISIDPPHMITFVGPTPSDKIIQIIKDGDHYDGCNSSKGFLNKSYFCDECNRGNNSEDPTHHPCKGKWCLSCKHSDCPDFMEAK